MKRYIRICFFCILTVVFFALPAAASSVSLLSVSASVDQEAVCTVSATVELYLDQSTEELQFTMPDGASGGTVTGYTAKKRNGTLVISQEGGFIGTNTFQLSWTVPASVEDNTDDVDDDENVQSVTVTIPLQGADCIWTVDQMTFQVSMPAAFTETPSVQSGYSGTLDSSEYVMEISGTVIAATLTGSLIDHEAISLSLVVPADYFSLTTVTGQSGLGLAALIVVLVLAAAAELYRRKKLQIRELDIRSRVQPPDNVTACAVPFLLDGGDPDPALLIPLWAELGYLTVSSRGHGRYVFQRRMDMGNERRDYETAMFSAMFAGQDTCQSTGRTYRRACVTLRKQLRRYWRTQAYAEKSGNPAIVRWLTALGAGAACAAAAGALLPSESGWTALVLVMLLPGIWAGLQIQKLAGADRWRTPLKSVLPGLMCTVALPVLGAVSGEILVCLAALAAQIWFGYALRYGAARTERGCEMLEQLLGLRKFLISVSPARLQALLQKQPRYYYDLLPFAAALGVGKKFSSRFGDRQMEVPDWLDTGSRRTMTALQFYDIWREMLQAFHASAGSGTTGEKKRKKF